MSLQVRIYNTGLTSYRVFPLSRVASIPNARVTASMGYADAEIILYGTLEDSALQDWQKRRRVEFWFDGSLGYRGYIERIQPLQMEPKQTQVTLYGRYYRLGRMNLQKRYSYATVTGSSAGDVVVAGREIASIYQDLLSRFILPYQSNLEAQAFRTGYGITTLDAFNATLSSVTDQFISYTAQNVVIGCDVNGATGNDRVYIRPNDSTIVTPITSPSGSTGAKTSDDDTTALVNTLTIIGGNSQFANLLAPAVQGNTSFEMPLFSGLGQGNLVKDPSFEATPGSGVYTFGSGASLNSSGDGTAAGFARTGNSFGVVDNPGEVISQNNTQGNNYSGGNYDYTTTPTVGVVYQFNLYAKLTFNGNPVPFTASADMTLTWQNAGGSTVSSTTLRIAPTSGNYYTQYGFSSVCPATATKYVLSLTCVTGITGKGIVTDDWEFFGVSQTVQRGWELVANGSASYAGSNLAFEDAYHGGYSVFVNATASDVDGQDLDFQPVSRSRFAVNAQQQLRYGFYGKLAPGQTTHPKMVLVCDIYDSSGNLIIDATNARRFTIAANTLTSTWGYKESTFTVPTTGATCVMYLQIRGTGQVLLDAFYCRDSTVAAGTFLESLQYQTTYNVITAGFGASTDVYQQNVTNGAITDVLATIVSVPSVTTDADALSYAQSYFSRYAVSQTRNSITVYNFLPVWVGQYIRIIGANTGVFPRPTTAPIQPINEILLEWDGKLKQTIFLSTERLTEARVIKRLVGAIAGGGSVGGATLVGGGVGGSINGYSGLAALSPDPSGTYNAASKTFTINSAGQVTSVGTGTPTSGSSGFMYIGKLTAGGNNGTALLTNGQVTIVSQAT